MGALVWFDEAACEDVAVAGGKGASLAAMAGAGLPVPPGFVVPAGIEHAARFDTDSAEIEFWFTQ